MKTLIALLLILSTQTLSAASFNEHVLAAIRQMPEQGGYVLTGVSPRSMNAAFTWVTPEQRELALTPALATPSYCTTATYMVFFLALKAGMEEANLTIAPETFAFLRPKLENDGVGSWGRWNANGPGTAKYLYDAKMAKNFDDIELAQPGDFLKIYWNEFVGKRELGHSVVYLGRRLIDGVEHIEFWSSNKSTNGFGAKLIPRSQAIRTLFTRVEKPENVSNLAKLPLKDEFLMSMLEVDSSWEELRKVTGIE